MNGKGDKPRPMQVTRKQFSNNWDAIKWPDRSKDKPQSGNHQSRGLDGKAKQV